MDVGLDACPEGETMVPVGLEQEMPLDEDVSDEEVNTQLSQVEQAVAYRQNFSSENFKIEIQNLPNFCGIGQMKKFLNKKLKLNTHKLKPCGPKKNYMFVCFKWVLKFGGRDDINVSYVRTPFLRSLKQDEGEMKYFRKNNF